jgi:Cytochrome C oxidase, cbb3-type, subunit III
MKFELPLSLSTLVLLAPLVLAPLGCDSGDEGGDEAADTSDGTDSTDGMDTTDGGPDLANGQAIHDSTCAVAGCHSAADMVSLAVEVPMLDDAGLTEQIRNGSTGDAGTMPGFNINQISEENLVDLIAFLRQMYP